MRGYLLLLPAALALAGCAEPRCGDGILDAGLGEACDDGNELSGDGCDANCTQTGCANGAAPPGELSFPAPKPPPATAPPPVAALITELDGRAGLDLLVLTQSSSINALLNNG